MRKVDTLLVAALTLIQLEAGTQEVGRFLISESVHYGKSLHRYSILLPVDIRTSGALTDLRSYSADQLIVMRRAYQTLNGNAIRR